MKNIYYFKSLFRTSLVALCLLTIGVGNTWAGTKRIYAEYSAVSSWWGNDGRNALPYIYAWGGGHDAKKYTMTATGTSNLAYCDIDDYHTDLLFYRSTSESGSWDNQTVDVSIGSDNRWSILDTETGGKKNVNSAQRWVPGVCIDGLVDVHNPHTQAFSFSGNDGTYAVTLSAHSTYQFCIRDGSTRYTLDNNVWTSNISNYTLNTSGYDIRLTTAGAGTYTFTYNKSTHVISVAYPTVSHPNIDYCYMYGYTDWDHKYIHVWNSSSSIAGTTWPGTEMFNYITISSNKYYYYAPGDYAKSMPNNNNDGQKTSELTNSQGYGKYMKHDGSAWVWNTFTVRIQLENDDATYVGTEYQDIAFNSGVLSDITCPTKTHYDFGGYYTEEGGTGTQVINSEGKWIASVADYTDASKHWIHAGTSTTLYAKWTEHEYDLTINISPTGAGTVSPSPTKVTYVTPTALLTATPSNPAYIFKEWQYSTNVGPYGGTGNDNTVQITAAQNGTLTAVFEPRYRLVGSLTDDGDPAGGMPGWTNPDADAKAFIVNSISPSVNMTKTCTLNPNSWYKFEIHDKKANKNYGHGDGTFVISGSQSFDAQDRTVLFQTKGRGEYTFTISAITESGGLCYPTVSVSGPTSYQMNLLWADVDIDGNWWKTSRETGGTVAAVATENGSNTAITNGQYVASGGSITYTATPASGYTFDGWWNTNWTYNFANVNPHTSSSIGATENVEGKFIEKYTTVTISANNTAGGTITVNSSAFSWGNTKTAGVTTKRALVVTPNTGYNFTGWTLSNSPDFELQDQASETDLEVTLAGLGGTNGSTGTLTAGFTAKTYTVTLNDDHGGSYNGTATATYASSTLTSKTDATFSGWTLLGYWNNTGVQVIDSEGALIASVANYTDESSNWIYDGNVTLYAHWSRTITLDKKEGSSNGSVTVTYQGTAETPSAPSRTGYSVEGYYAETGLTNKVMNPNGSMVASVSGYTNGSSEWIHNTASTLYTKWTANPYTVTLENQGATSAGTENVSVTYDASTNLTSSITCPTKTHYTFGGYFTEAGGAGTQLINADGSWKESVAGYTSATKQWIHVGDITLYAKWTENLYTVNVAVSPAEAGSVQVNSSNVTSVTNVGYATHSAVMTAVPTNAAWVFKEWQKTSAVNLDLEHYSTTGTTMEITATAADQTLTAVFQKRYELVGSVWDGESNGGMPGWLYDGTGEFTINSFTAVDTDNGVDLTYSCTLTSNTAYKLRINDRGASKVYGKNDPSADYYTLPANASAELSDYGVSSEDVWIQTGDASGLFTFRITKMRNAGEGNRYYPTLSVDRPQQVNFGRRRVDIDGGAHDDNIGGTLAVTKTSGGASVTSGDWLTYGTDVTYTTSATSGYTLTWYTSDAYSSTFSAGGIWSHALTSTDNCYAQFTEQAKTVTINKTGSGTITVGGSAFTWGNTKTCGVTTTRALVATAATGYSFTGWTVPDGVNFQLDDYAGGADNEVTLRGKTSGSTGTLTANFTANNYSVTLDNDHGNPSNNGSATATYDATSLSVSSHATFSGWTLLGYWNNTGVQTANADGSLIANVGGYTGAGGIWTSTSDATLYAHWSRSITLDDNGGSADGSVTVNYNQTTTSSVSAPTRNGYSVEGYYADNECTHKVMEPNGTLVNYTGYVESGKWVHQTATTLYAKWNANSYTVTLHNDHGDDSDDGMATVTYDATSLTVSKHATFDGWTLLGYWNNSAIKVVNADGSLIASVDGFTDGSAHWTKAGNADLWAHWSRTITLNDNVEQRHNGSVSVTYNGAAASHTAPKSREGYTLDGYYAEAGCSTKVMNANGTLASGVSGYTDGSSNWTHKTASTLYAKWTSDHFIIYRTGDKAGDPRATYDDVESYGGGTISEAIEYRMKVHELDNWYSLCLPFTVTAVKVWDEGDGEYYDLVPYYRTEVGAELQGGHYIIRTPKQTSDLLISEFGDWRDPTYATGWLPSKNTPYIIQWHMGYFRDKYISFFSATGEDIPTSFSAGSAPTSDNVVNVCYNNSMTSGSVTGAYVLVSDYGDGAWLRGDKPTDNMTIPPFECYIRASSTATGKYLVIRRDMTIEDTPTDVPSVTGKSAPGTNKVLLNGQLYIIRGDRMYTIQGTLVEGGK